MTKRTWMIEKRESLGLSREQMAEKCNPRNRQTGEYLHPGQVSDNLIEMLEEDDICVTPPGIVKRIAKVYGMSKDERTQLLPFNYRPGPEYNPDRYKDLTDCRFFVIKGDH